MKSLEKAQKIIFIVLAGIYFTYAAGVLFQEARLCLAQFRTMRGFSQDQKRLTLLGDFMGFADTCNKIIPENARVLLLTNLESIPGSEDLKLNYFVYPRKLYWLDLERPYPDTIPDFDEKKYCALQQRGINWIVYMYSAPVALYKIVQLEDCRVIASHTLAWRNGPYGSDM